MKWSAKEIPSKAQAIDGERTQWTFEGVRGLTLECLGNGGRVWKVRYQVQVGGRRIERKYELGRLDPEARRAIGHDNTGAVLTPGQAKDRATAILARVDDGSDPWQEERAALHAPPAESTFGATFELWLERYAKVHKKSWAADEKLYHRHVEDRLGKDVARNIDRPRVIEVLDDIAKNATPLQANRAQSLISAVLSWALDEGRITSHPALRIRRRGQERQREIVMTPEQLKAFWKALDDVHPNAMRAIKLLLLLGQRLGEVVGAPMTEFRLNSNDHAWTIPSARTKNGITHAVPLPSVAVKIIREQEAIAKPNPFLFPARRREPQGLDGDQVSRQFKALARKIGASEMRLHDLRHQAATGMAECGVPLDMRQLVQNQITGRRQSIGARYDQHDYLAEKRRALELWEQRLMEIVEGRPASGLRW